MFKNKIGKVVTIILLIIVILIQNINSFAAVAVTKENLQKAFDDLVKYTESSDVKIEIKVEDEIIKFKVDGVDYEAKYNLGEKQLTFTTETEIKKGISYEEYEILAAGVLSPLIYSYTAVAKVQGVEIEDSIFYCVFTILLSSLLNTGLDSNSGFTIVEDGDPSIIYDKTKHILKSEFPERVIEYIDTMFENKQIFTDMDSNNTFEIIVEKDNVEENTRKIIGKMEINLEGDFEKIKESMESDLEDFNDKIEEEIKDSFTDWEENGENNSIIYPVKIKNKSIAMANILLQENEKEALKYSDPNLSKYPNAGLEENKLVPIIEIAIGILFAALVLMINKVKKINKN